MRSIILLFTTIICGCVTSTPVESNFHKNVQNSVNKLNVDFTKILLNNYAEPEKNALFSPLNIYTALALVHLGATGITRDELSSVLGFPNEDSKLAETHKNLGQFLRDLLLQHGEQKAIDVRISNGIFAQKGFQIKDSYVREAKNNYQSEGVQQVDFAKGGPEATDIVNKWVARSTQNRIPKLYNDEIPKNTVLLLASALYFAAKWNHPFYKFATKPEKFNTATKEILVQTMNATENVLYYDNQNLKYEALSLDFWWSDFAMVFLLPYRDQTVKTLVDALKPQDFQQTVSNLTLHEVNYKIPRMKFGWSQDLNDYFVKLGIKQMFQVAQLGNMVEEDNLAVSKVKHAAEIEVEEEGVKASAVTAIQFFPTSLEPPASRLVNFYIDRPFVFHIYHTKTQIPLFTGIVNNPSSE